MPKWTKEQQQAIDLEGSNIIVSAGAGSGKTAVLSERVIRKLEQGVDIDHLLILTFTKAAAFEMMIRIRNKIKERPQLKEQLDRIDSAYITTFDSYSLALVKKYHYLLNVNKDIKIMNQNIMDIERKIILDKIFDKYYMEQNPKFFKMLDQFTIKDDQEIKDLILTINSKLDLKYDKVSFLNNYIDTFYKEDNIKNLIKEYEKFLLNKISLIKDTFTIIGDYVEEDYRYALENSLSNFFSSTNYDEIKKHSDIKLKNLPKNSCEEAKILKEQMSSYLKEIKEYLIYESNEEIENLLLESKDTIQILINIILQLDNEVYIYKFKNDSYEFTDISKMAIKLVKENEEIRNDLKYYFNEIMVDEYQDTSDLQEAFISLIENNNVYMVGDIKQSIYRFRNANPYIFKNKYDNYTKHLGGEKIDLIKNFRSRKEVLNNINYIFNYIMDDFLGGCKYKEEHQMVFGNMMYEDEKNDKQNADFEVYNYVIDKDSNFKKDELEAFIILDDINKKIKEGYQVVDKETFKIRNCTYSDFAILIDRASNFELYKKIFEYKNIPLAVYKDTSITKEDDINILSNLLKLIYFSYHKIFNEEFRYSFLSVARSYLTDMNDGEIFRIMKNNSYFESSILEKIKPILKEYHKLNATLLIEKVIDIFSFYERQVFSGNMEHLMARMSYIKDVFLEMDELGYNLDEVILKFGEMVEEGYDIKVSLLSENKNAVKIMTIHKSKGLEFPILYMSGLSNKFNIRDLNEKFLFDSKYGFIIPFFKDSEITSISKFLMKNDYIQEEISEKIRLFYVALTRAKEKMIFITCNDKEEDSDVDVELVDNYKRLKYRSFLDIFKSIWSSLNIYKKDIDLSKIDHSKDYNLIKSSNFEKSLKKGKQKFVYDNLNFDSKPIENIRYSKSNYSLLTPENYDAIQLGKRFHSIFENLDFLNPNFNSLSQFEVNHVKNFLNLSIFDNIDCAKIYKEYEFVFQEDNIIRHGIIDLMIEFPNKVLIIDYKLKQVSDSAYKKQLYGYRDYIKSKIDKSVEIYLYSILDEELIQLN